MIVFFASVITFFITLDKLLNNVFGVRLIDPIGQKLGRQPCKCGSSKAIYWVRRLSSKLLLHSLLCVCPFVDCCYMVVRGKFSTTLFSLLIFSRKLLTLPRPPFPFSVLHSGSTRTFQWNFQSQQTHLPNQSTENGQEQRMFCSHVPNIRTSLCVRNLPHNRFQQMHAGQPTLSFPDC